MISTEDIGLNKRDQIYLHDAFIPTGGTYVEINACLIELGHSRAGDTGI